MIFLRAFKSKFNGEFDSINYTNAYANIINKKQIQVGDILTHTLFISFEIHSIHKAVTQHGMIFGKQLLYRLLNKDS